MRICRIIGVGKPRGLKPAARWWGFLACTPLGILLVPIAASAGGPFDYQDPPQGTFVDEWMTVELDGARVGYTHTTIMRNGDEIRYRMLMQMTMQRAGQTITITQMEATHETLDGRPVGFESAMGMGEMEIVKQGRIRDGKINMVSSQFGLETRQTYDYPKGALMYWGLHRKQMEMGFEPGTSYSVDTYVPGIMPTLALKTTTLIEGREDVDVMGQMHHAIKSKNTLVTPFGTIVSYAWTDESGTMLVAEVPMMGLGTIRMIRTDRETAQAQTEAPEFFMPTLVKVSRSIDRDAAKTIRYRLSVKDPDNDVPKLPTTEMQTPGERVNRTVELTVSRIDHQRLRDMKFIAPYSRPSGMDEYLASNAMMNLDDGELVAMATKAADGATHPYVLADNLRRYVTDVIVDKNLTVAFASASEVCRNREGDCSEHAVLLAALGRVVGLPSRVVTGLVYVPTFQGADHVFGFHMWTQFYFAGRWIDFDAAQRESDCNPTHIALGTSSLEGGSLMEAAFALIGTLGQLEIGIEDIQTSAGRR